MGRPRGKKDHQLSPAAQQPQECSRCHKVLKNLAGLRSHQRHCPVPPPHAPPPGTKRRGRHPELTRNDVWDKLLEAAVLDLYYDDAAAYAGLTYECLRSYIARGEEDLAEGRATLYSTFVSEFRKREAQGRAHRVGNIIAAGRKEQHWQANAWLLERRHPQKYGRRQLDVHTTGQQTVDVVVHQVPVPVEPPVLEGVLVRGSEAPTGGREGENGTNGGGRVLLPPSSGEGSDSGGNGG